MLLRFWLGSGGICQISAHQAGMAGEGRAGLAVDEEADFGDGRKVFVQGLDDGEQGEGFRLDAGGLRVGEGRVEVDDSELVAGLVGNGHEENAIDPG